MCIYAHIIPTKQRGTPHNQTTEKMKNAIENAARIYLQEPFLEEVFAGNLQLPPLADMAKAKRDNIIESVKAWDRRMKDPDSIMEKVEARARRVLSNRMKWDNELKDALTIIRNHQGIS